MTEQHSPLTDIKPHIYQVIDQFPLDRLPEISLFLEQLLKVINTPNINQSVSPNPSLLTEEHPWLKFAGMFADDPNWEEFQEAIAESRREIDATEGVL